MRRLVAIFGLVLLTVVLATCASYAERRRLITDSLRVRDGVFLYVPEDEPYHGAAPLLVTEPRLISHFELDRVPTDIFYRLESGDAALELCELRHWGVRIVDPAAWERMLAVYEGEGYRLEPATAELAECRVFDVERRFDTAVQAEENGWLVAFTAYVLEPGMGARARLARYRYRVGVDAQLEPIDVVTYLEGPVLNRQRALTSEPTAEDVSRMQAEDEAEAARRVRLIRGVYQLGAYPIPRGR